MELILSAEEQRLLEQILEERHLALQREIARTDRREFKVTLRNNERLIESILSRLRTQLMTQAS
jgi:hypothetical protein